MLFRSEKSQQLLSNIEQFMIELAFQNDFEVEFPRLSLANLFKSAGICLKEDDICLSEKLLIFIDLMTSQKLASVFVFVNLRSLLDEENMKNFTESCCCHGYNIMLIDNHAEKNLPREKRTTIDIDLCEF